MIMHGIHVGSHDSFAPEPLRPSVEEQLGRGPDGDKPEILDIEPRTSELVQASLVARDRFSRVRREDDRIFARDWRALVQ